MPAQRLWVHLRLYIEPPSKLNHASIKYYEKEAFFDCDFVLY